VGSFLLEREKRCGARYVFRGRPIKGAYTGEFRRGGERTERGTSRALGLFRPLFFSARAVELAEVAQVSYWTGKGTGLQGGLPDPEGGEFGESPFKRF